jgi:hypothetical protein
MPLYTEGHDGVHAAQSTSCASQTFRELIPSLGELLQGKLVEVVDLGFHVHPVMVLAGMPVQQEGE